jgi:AbrB family looped-hinge helix DNA binding protein
MPLAKLSKNFQVTIPASLRRGIDLKEGDYLDVTVEDGAFIFKPIQIREKNTKKGAKKSGGQE